MEMVLFHVTVVLFRPTASTGNIPVPSSTAFDQDMSRLGPWSPDAARESGSEPDVHPPAAKTTQNAAQAHAEETRVERDLKGDMVTTIRSCDLLTVRPRSQRMAATPALGRGMARSATPTPNDRSAPGRGCRGRSMFQ